MMSIKISTNDLEMISRLPSGQCISELTRFISDERDYYIYGREPIDADFVQISLQQIKQLVAEISDGPTHDILAQVYQAGYLTGQEYVYLYGRSRCLDCEVAVQ